MAETVLVIGNRNYSSWSLRGWLALVKSGARFEVRRLAFGSEEFRRELPRLSPSRRVPVLHHAGRVVWDSLAIAEYANETFAGGDLWPRAVEARAHARSASAEMHAGFPALRAELPMNCRAHGRHIEISGAAKRDIARVESLWQECRMRFGAGGPWLYGGYSIADAVYAPVATRFATYGVAFRGVAGEYLETALADSNLVEWIAAAAAETEIVAEEERGA